MTRTPKAALRTFAPRVRDDLRWLAEALKAGDLDDADAAVGDALGALVAISEAIDEARTAAAFGSPPLVEKDVR